MTFVQVPLQSYLKLGQLRNTMMGVTTPLFMQAHAIDYRVCLPVDITKKRDGLSVVESLCRDRASLRNVQ